MPFSFDSTSFRGKIPTRDNVMGWFQKNNQFTAGPAAQRMYNSAWAQAGLSELKMGWGFGEQGLFNKSIFDPLHSGTSGGSGFGQPSGGRWWPDPSGASTGHISAFRGASAGTKAKFLGRVGFRALAPAYAVGSVVSGYNREGLTGAIGSGLRVSAEFAAWGMARTAAGAVLGSAAIPLTIGTAATVGLGYGAYKALEHGNKVRKQLRKTEMGGQVIDHFGTAATMRSRSLSAMHNSQITGRTAFGTEASLMHVPVMR